MDPSPVPHPITKTQEKPMLHWLSHWQLCCQTVAQCLKQQTLAAIAKVPCMGLLPWPSPFVCETWLTRDGKRNPCFQGLWTTQVSWTRLDLNWNHYRTNPNTIILSTVNSSFIIRINYTISSQISNIIKSYIYYIIIILSVIFEILISDIWYLIKNHTEPEKFFIFWFWSNFLIHRYTVHTTNTHHTHHTRSKITTNEMTKNNIIMASRPGPYIGP